MLVAARRMFWVPHVGCIVIYEIATMFSVWKAFFRLSLSDRGDLNITMIHHLFVFGFSFLDESRSDIIDLDVHMAVTERRWCCFDMQLLEIEILQPV
jgi:hypothetical protein